MKKGRRTRQYKKGKEESYEKRYEIGWVSKGGVKTPPECSRASGLRCVDAHRKYKPEEKEEDGCVESVSGSL